MARKPVAGIDHQIPHGPVPVIEVEIIDPSEAAVRRRDGESPEVVDAAQNDQLSFVRSEAYRKPKTRTTQL
jgi:hypothetical protein